MSNKADLPLAGFGVVITRPREQAATLAELIQQAGGNPILFPLLEIAPVEDYTAFDHAVSQLDAFDWAIFISSNAVQHGMHRLLAFRSFPTQVRCAAIGPSTTSELARFGIVDVVAPAHRFDSESLLNLPEMQEVSGKRCMIFRGIGGRDLLAKTLRDRGAEVSFAESYRRFNPNENTSTLEKLWEKGMLHALIVTSSEALRNLLDLSGAHPGWLQSIPVFVNHARIADSARQYGLKALVASAPGDPGMLEALIQWQKVKTHD